MNITAMQWALLERIGRARYQVTFIIQFNYKIQKFNRSS